MSEAASLFAASVSPSRIGRWARGHRGANAPHLGHGLATTANTFSAAPGKLRSTSHAGN